MANKFGSLGECEQTCVHQDVVRVVINRPIYNLTRIEEPVAQSENCNQPRYATIPGPKCEAYMLKWEYNNETSQCQQFVFGGCPSMFPSCLRYVFTLTYHLKQIDVANKFETLEDCQKSCHRSQRQQPRTQSPKCQGQRYYNVPGYRCMAYIPKWEYNTLTGQCNMFIWGGCPRESFKFSLNFSSNSFFFTFSTGVENMFNSMEECQTSCLV